jgi:membrane-associated phospholipid phosphatase
VLYFRRNIAVLTLCASLHLVTATALAQQPSQATVQTPKTPHNKAECSIEHLDRCFVDTAKDQAGIWTSPLRMRKAGAIWFIPFAGATGASIYYDTDMMKHIGTTPTQQDFGKTVSKYSAPYFTFGAAGGMYILGAVTHNQHVRETGLLGAEAVVDASILAEGLKLATNRDRPNQGNGNGGFWPDGTGSINTNASMPSGHAEAIWAFARVLDMQYSDRPLVKILAYGSAVTVSVARVMVRDHFPSDVIVGGMFGFLTGDYVVRHHSSEYKDAFSYSVTPVFQSGPLGTRGVALSITAPKDFDYCSSLHFPGKKLLQKLDSRCSSARGPLTDLVFLRSQ